MKKVVRVLNYIVLAITFLYLMNMPELPTSPKDFLNPMLCMSGVYFLIYVISVRERNAKLGSGIALIMISFYISYLYKTFAFRDVIFESYIYLAATIYLTLNIIASEFLFPTKKDQSQTSSSI